MQGFWSPATLASVGPFDSMPTPQPADAAPLTPAAFAARFRESSRVLWCVAAAVLGDRHQAEDVLQEAAMTALGKLDTFRHEASFVAWMSGYVRYVALNQRRKRQRQADILRRDASSMGPSEGAEPDTPGFDANVLRALDSLGETARTCLLLKTVLELDYTEISELLEIPPGTAMSHVSRARGRMQKLLAQERPQVGHRGAG